MDFERRSILVALLSTMVSGCARAGAPKVAAATYWTDFKSRFMEESGRIVDTGNRNISHSEGQGYALVMAEAAGDRSAFESLIRWTEANLARPRDALYSWRYDPSAPIPVNDPNNATDGDILIAWALMRAADRWQKREWRDRSRAIRSAIYKQLVHVRGPRTVLLPGLSGFDFPDRTSVNLSYYIWPALDQFQAADSRAVWGKVISDGEALIRDSRFGPLGLPTDWIDVAADGRVSPAAGKPPRFGFDAIRVPLYLSLGGRAAAAEPIVRFWRSYADQGRPIPAWVDVVSGATAEFALSEGGCLVARRLLQNDKAPVCAPQPGNDYYSSVLRLLAGL